MKSSRKVLASLITTCFAIALPGCSDPKSAAVGTYEVDKASLKTSAEADMKAKGENDPAAMAADMRIRMIDQMTWTMTLNSDGTASIVSNMMDQNDSAIGTWTISGNSIAITAAGPGATAIPFTGTISGDTITLKPPEGDEMPFDLVFKKKG